MKPSLTIGYPLLIRTILPGITIAVLSIPILFMVIGWISEPFLHLVAKNIWIYLSAQSIILGFTLTFLDNYIYKIYEGYLLWPDKLYELRTNSLNKKVKRMTAYSYEIAEKDNKKFDKIWYWLRDFPIGDDGDPCAVAPTKLGNIIYEYEEYPGKRYNMHPSFYWSRVWLIADDNSRRPILSAESEAAGSLYITFASLILSTVYLGIIIFRYFVKLPSLPGTPFFNLMIFQRFGLFFTISAFTSLLSYIITIPLHRQSGELYKALFDVSRNKLSNLLGDISINTEQLKWDSYWSYLHYLRIRCKKCTRLYHYTEDRCPYCQSNKYKAMRINTQLYWSQRRQQEIERIRKKLFAKKN